VRSAVLVCGAILLATTAATNAQHSDATIVVTKFYNWYLAEHGNVDWYPPEKGAVDWDRAIHHHSKKYFEARAFFHPILFEDLDQTYLKAIEDTTPPIYVSTTPDHNTAKMSGFDPYVGASSPATSYRVGASWAGRAFIGGVAPEQLRNVTLVPVTFTLAKPPSSTQITVLVRKNGSSYQIYDIHYPSIPFYYAGQITDLLHFLGAYNC
jgi:hypothetical protein